MNNVRIERMMRELQSEPVTEWFCRLFALMEPREMVEQKARRSELEPALTLGQVARS